MIQVSNKIFNGDRLLFCRKRGQATFLKEGTVALSFPFTSKIGDFLIRCQKSSLSPFSPFSPLLSPVLPLVYRLQDLTKTRG